MPNPPGNVKNLQSRVSKCAEARGSTVRRIQTVVANTIIGQMLPPGIVKGGTAMKMRRGESESRFTPDLDAARAADITLDDYLDQLQDALADGWGDFSATLERVEPRAPDDVPEDYIMQPFDIRLSYRGRHWCTVRFELGRDEVGSTASRDLRLAPDIVELFAELALPEPGPLPVLAAVHQAVQKLHACTYVNQKTGSNERAHDLVDLQILDEDEDIDMAAVHQVAVRLFAARRAQPWPPTVIAYDNWDTLYAEAAEGLQVVSDVSDAVDWANAFIDRAVQAGDSSSDQTPELNA